MVTQVLHVLYILSLGICLHSSIDAFDIFDLSPLLLQYSLFLAVFYVCGFACDNSELRRQEVHLLPARPPKPRGYYKSRRKHRHYFRRKFRSFPIRLNRVSDLPSKSFPMLTPTEESQDLLDSIAKNRHKFLHLSWITIDINLNTNLSEFVRSIDPLRTFRLMKLLQSQPLFHHSANANPDKNCSPLFCTAATHVDPIHDPSFQFASALLHTPGSTDSDMDIYSFLTKSEILPIVLDTGASTSLTPILSDFIGPLEPAPLSEIRGLTATTKVVGRGRVQWTVRDYWNVTGVIETDAYYVPDASIRLFSPQFYFQEYQHAGRCIIQGMKTTLELPNKTVLEFPYNPRSNLPLMLTDQPVSASIGRADLASFLSTSSTLLSVTDQTNQNLRPAQKELLLWHFKLGHAGFQWCQKLCRVPKDPFREQVIIPKHSNVSYCDAPLCTACQLSKQTRRTPEVKTQVNPVPTIRKPNLQPGDCISVDQYVSALPGRLPHTKGKESKDSQYNGGTLFVDHASGYVFLRNQVCLTAGETLKSKKAFEQFASSAGVTLKAF
jgi:hypothetical protein